MNRAPKWFLIVAVLALLWNLMGCAAYLADVMLGPEDLEKMNEAQRAMYDARPSWAVAATAIAVWLGALGCLGLILRKRWSLPVLGLSLLGVVAQDIWLFVLGNAGAVAGPVVYVLQGIVLAVAIGLVLLSRHGIERGWLT